jgi:phosphoenolpyruvate-protein phosphotransferase (PTS system enzyme I)
MSTTLKGIGVSSGIASGVVMLLSSSINVERRLIGEEEVQSEIDRFKDGLNQCVKSIQTVIDRAQQQVSGEEVAILEAHLLIANDPALVKAVTQKVGTERKCAAWAAEEVLDSYIAMFEKMEDEYLRQRVADIAEVRKTLLRLLSGHKSEERILKPNSVIVADDLGPAETLSLDRTLIAAFVTAKGGRTSHTSILARALGIPAVVGVQGILEVSIADAPILVDADKSEVIVNPTGEQQAESRQRIQRQEEEQAYLRKCAHQPAVTADGKKIALWANIGNASEVAAALANGAEGIGLFRTEFLYMDKTELPSEQEQEEVYRQVLEAMESKPVVIRTLDLGADKRLPYMPLKEEENPALGCRAIRLCLKEKELLKTQLRALLKASVSGNLWIMFPMIAAMEELHAAKAVLQEVRDDLAAAGIPVAGNSKVGMMIEVPAAAINADLFAGEVDFFSIGSNDLIQYVFAADRQNQEVDYLYQPANPAILRLIDNTVRAAHTAGIPVGMCGEMAGDIAYTQLLIGLGLDELSMASGSLLKMKKAVGSIDSANAADRLYSAIKSGVR